MQKIYIYVSRNMYYGIKDDSLMYFSAWLYSACTFDFQKDYKLKQTPRGKKLEIGKLHKYQQPNDLNCAIISCLMLTFFSPYVWPNIQNAIKSVNRFNKHKLLLDSFQYEVNKNLLDCKFLKPLFEEYQSKNKLDIYPDNIQWDQFKSIGDVFDILFDLIKETVQYTYEGNQLYGTLCSNFSSLKRIYELDFKFLSSEKWFPPYISGVNAAMVESQESKTARFVNPNLSKKFVNGQNEVPMSLFNDEFQLAMTIHSSGDHFWTHWYKYPGVECSGFNINDMGSTKKGVVGYAYVRLSDFRSPSGRNVKFNKDSELVKGFEFNSLLSVSDCETSNFIFKGKLSLTAVARHLEMQNTCMQHLEYKRKNIAIKSRKEILIQRNRNPILRLLIIPDIKDIPECEQYPQVAIIKSKAHKIKLPNTIEMTRVRQLEFLTDKFDKPSLPRTRSKGPVSPKSKGIRKSRRVQQLPPPQISYNTKIYKVNEGGSSNQWSIYAQQRYFTQ